MTLDLERANAIAALQRAGATGATVEVVPSDEAGAIDLDALAAMLDRWYGLATSAGQKRRAVGSSRPRRAS